jgi:hypothetical protein
MQPSLTPPPAEQKHVVKVPPMQTLSQALAAAASKFKPALVPEQCALHFNKKPVDLHTPFRLLNVPAGSKLEVLISSEWRAEDEGVVCKLGRHLPCACMLACMHSSQQHTSTRTTRFLLPHAGPKQEAGPSAAPAANAAAAAAAAAVPSEPQQQVGLAVQLQAPVHCLALAHI